LLQWSRLQQGRMDCEPANLDLKEMVVQTTRLLAETANSKGIGLQNTIPEGLLVYADENMLDTVIRNLASNALKFTPSGGQVTISAHPVAESVELIEVSVSDTGVGISKKDQSKLFRLDHVHTTQGTAKEQGTGLGLIICQEMIQKNGGQIWIESEVGQGTSIKFTIPVTEGTSVD
jgi:two-component system sensor histidine kinase/response regulator